MTAQHTPGPWHWSGDSLTHRQFNIYAPGNSPREHIATVNNLPVDVLWGRSPDEALANARLIAAAPELLEALQEVSETFNESWREGSTQRRLGDLARAAIAKATD